LVSSSLWFPIAVLAVGHFLASAKIAYLLWFAVAVARHHLSVDMAWSNENELHSRLATPTVLSADNFGLCSGGGQNE